MGPQAKVAHQPGRVSPAHITEGGLPMSDSQGSRSSRTKIALSPARRQEGRPTEEELLLRWDDDIGRAARSASARWGLGPMRADDLAQEARLRVLRVIRRGGPTEEPYLRSVIADAVRKAARKEARAMALLSTDNAGTDQETDAPDPSPGIDPSAVDVARWLRSLPRKLQALFDLIYARDITQRDISLSLGISQPRVAQLHRQLLQGGRAELAHVMAS
jgi:RNA polymerase sigma factor (sigma-70 family)